MLAELPMTLQIKVLQYLNTDNFPQAKALHDLWVAQQNNDIGCNSGYCQ